MLLPKLEKVIDPKSVIELPIIGPKRNTAINTSKIEYVELNANPIQGCSHACKYCYAKKIDLRFKKVEDEDEWHSPKYFVNFFDLLEKELKRGKINPKKEIFMSTMTDLYQPYSIKHGISTRLISLVQEYNCKYRILTKSHRIVKDKHLLAYSKGKVGLSITTSSNNEKERKYWESKTPSINKRLDALRELDEFGGIPLWVSAEPFLPGTDFKRYYEEIISAGGASLKEIVIGKMNYESGVDEKFDWEEVVRISEDFRSRYKHVIRFHYKKEFWNYLKKKKLTPVDLDFAPSSDFCHQDDRTKNSSKKKLL